MPSYDANGAVRGITRRYYAVWLIYSLAGGFLFGVYPIFLHSRGLDQFEINSVLAAYFVVLFLTDVPTGAFADALGRRRSFVLGTALRACAFVVYFFARHYWVFLIAESIDGIGTTFGNGAIDAWGVDALDMAGYEGLKDRLFSRIMQLTTIGFMVSAIFGAYIADINIAWPWLCGAAGYVISAAIGYSLMTGEKPNSEGVHLLAIPGMIVRRVISGFSAGFDSKVVLMLSAAGAIQVAAWSPYWLEWPLLDEPELRRRRLDYRMDILRAVGGADAGRGDRLAHTARSVSARGANSGAGRRGERAARGGRDAPDPAEYCPDDSVRDEHFLGRDAAALAELVQRAG